MHRQPFHSVWKCSVYCSRRECVKRNDESWRRQRVTAQERRSILSSLLRDTALRNARGWQRSKMPDFVYRHGNRQTANHRSYRALSLPRSARNLPWKRGWRVTGANRCPTFHRSFLRLCSAGYTTYATTKISAICSCNFKDDFLLSAK